MFLSIIIPLYNTEDYIEECLDSVLAASIPKEDYEVIVIDDGSTDGSKALVEAYQNKHAGFNIKLHSQENRGLGAARNIGIEKAKGDYLYFLDSDDRLRSPEFYKIYSDLRHNPLDAIFFDGESFYMEPIKRSGNINYKRKKSYGSYGQGEKLLSDFIKNGDYRSSACLYIFRRSIIKNKLSFPEKCRFEDNYFTSSLFFLINECKHIRLVAFERRVRAGSIMTTATLEHQFEDYSKIFWHMINQLELLPFHSEDGKKTYKKILSMMYRNIINSAQDLHLSKEQKEALRQVTAEAAKYRYFDWIGLLSTYAYPLYRRLAKIKKKIEKPTGTNYQ